MNMSFNPDHAVKYGFEEGILYSWLVQRERQKFLEINDYDDKYYSEYINNATWEQTVSVKEIENTFCFWHLKHIDKLLHSLIVSSAINVNYDEDCNFKISITR